MKVYNMTSYNTGRKIVNQFIIEHEGVIYFQSYQTIIAKIRAGQCFPPYQFKGDVLMYKYAF